MRESLHRGWRGGVLGENQHGHRECIAWKHTWNKELDPQPSCCEATAQTSAATVLLCVLQYLERSIHFLPALPIVRVMEVLQLIPAVPGAKAGLNPRTGRQLLHGQCLDDKHSQQWML